MLMCIVMFDYFIQPQRHLKYCSSSTDKHPCSGNGYSIDHRSTFSSVQIFTARCTLVQSAVLRSHVVCPSVCPSVRLSVCLSVTLVDQDHIGWKSRKLIARSLSLTPSLFGAQRISTYSQGNMGKFGGD